MSDLACFDLGGIAVALESRHRGWLAAARRRYSGFETCRRPEVHIRYTVTDGDEMSPEALFEARGQPLRGERRGRRLHLAGTAFTARLAAAGDAEIAGPLATYPVDLLLRAIWYQRRERGLIVHAAALAENGRGWLASGPSGSGKSTLASLFPDRALCDELAAVELVETGVRVAGLPFWHGRAGGAELAAIYLLRHGRENRRRRLPPSEAFARMRRQVTWPTFDSGAVARAFAALADLLQRLPVWELSFRPEPDVWDLIAAEAAA